MAAYLLKDIPPELWATVKARARADDLELKELLMAMIYAYAHGEFAVHVPAVRVSAKPEPVPDEIG